MSMIDIQQGFSHLSTDEIIRYAQSGVLYTGEYCLSDFVDYLLLGYKDKEDVDKLSKEAYDEGYSDGCSEYSAAIREAIEILESV